MSRSDDAARTLAAILRTPGAGADDQWRTWASSLMKDPLSPALLWRLWREVVEFDDKLAHHVAHPVPVPEGTVVVAGSGKEGFKTFNVTTAAGILAAAAGVPVVKGVSRSVSAVSGAADVLERLGIAPLTDPEQLPSTLERDTIAFVSYAAFCPAYARRYDGVFSFLTPLSFFMPIAVLRVRASSYLYGIAHPDVALAAHALRGVRPDLARGTVVATELDPGEFVDEHTGYGTRYTATTRAGAVRRTQSTATVPPACWRTAVAHGQHHADNAASLCASLAPEGDTALTRLVEHNAALIVSASGATQHSARLVRQARTSGAAQRLLARLRLHSDKAVA